MEISDSSARQGSRLLQFGALFFLLALLVGLIVPRFAAPRLALSTHLLGIMQGIFLMLLGLLWPRLRLGHVGARAVPDCWRRSSQQMRWRQKARISIGVTQTGQPGP